MLIKNQEHFPSISSTSQRGYILTSSPSSKIILQTQVHKTSLIPKPEVEKTNNYEAT